ncbi:MAG: hypothetical protein GTO22_08655 [Gemmatimonadales bacterium]|nr:hypothetical protein [Gemmatimonadales bacterium]
MAKRDLRHKLLGHLLECSGGLVVRDLNRTIHCRRCGGHLDMRTIPMTGQIVEECRRCGMSQRVQRFLPVAEDEK